MKFFRSHPSPETRADIIEATRLIHGELEQLQNDFEEAGVTERSRAGIAHEPMNTAPLGIWFSYELAGIRRNSAAQSIYGLGVSLIEIDEVEGFEDMTGSWRRDRKNEDLAWSIIEYAIDQATVGTVN